MSLFHAEQRDPGEAAFPHTPQGAAAVVVHVTARSVEETKHPALSLSLVCSSTRACKGRCVTLVGFMLLVIFVQQTTEFRCGEGGARSPPWERKTS